METSLQKIIAAIVGVLILFIIPVYIAFEKADDVSYSLAVKLTQNFVDNVRNKGYISPDMYSDFVSGLYATNNTYDVEIEHVKKRYDPAIYIYEKVEDRKGELLHVLDYDKYEDQYENKEITIDVGVYNLVNSNIEIKEASMTLADGSIIYDKNGDEIDPKNLYEQKIDQYRAQDRIVIDDGEVYADVRKVIGDKFDDDVYIPSIIDDTFKGEIKVVNKQGTEPDTLIYETFRDEYFNDNDGIFWGPTYTEESINYVPAVMRLKWANVSAQEAEELYYDRINEYRSEETSGDGRLVFDAGEIYADRDEVESKNGRIDTKLDIEADIKVEPGKIIINDDSKVEGFDSDLQDYDEYIAKYKNGETMVEEGEIYSDDNADIQDLRGAIWKVGTNLNDSNILAAETLYNNQLSNYENLGRVVVSRGEIYAVSNTATGYDSLTDEIRNVEVVGSININNPVGWEPTTLNFSQYIEEYRNSGQIEYIQGGTYEAERIEGSLTYQSGGETVAFDYMSNEDVMMDDSIDEITVKVIYEDDNVGFTNYPSITVKKKKTEQSNNTENSENVNIYDDSLVEAEPIYDTFSKTFYSIEEIKNVVDTSKIIIDGIEYEGIVTIDNRKVLVDENGNVLIDSQEYYGEEDCLINIETPNYLALEDKLPSIIWITEDDEKYSKICEYIQNGNITIEKTYAKEDLDFQREALEIKENGQTVYTLYHDLNKDKYDEYIQNAVLDNSGNVSSVTIESVVLSDKLDVTYTQINIQGRESIIITSENEYYLDQYYNDGRIVITPSEVWEYDEINIQHPKLTVYEKGTQNVLYLFDGKYDNKHEKYDEYINEYRTKGTITIIPTREYTEDDVTVIYEKIVIDPADEKYETLTFDDNHSKYENYLNQFETTGKIKLSEPEVYNVSDFLVEDPHIQIKLNGNVIIDIYEKDNKELYDEYKQQYLSTGKITLKYSINDISGTRARITISKLSNKDDISSVISTQVIEDNHENYLTYLGEYESTHMIIFDKPTIYSKGDLEVVDPSLTITDPDTGSTIVKYEGDYTKLDRDERYEIYESRVDEYNTNAQIINKEVTYIDGENCYFEKAHIVNEEVVTDKQIVAKLFKDTGVEKVEFLRQCMLGNGDMYNSLIYMNENSYIMNEGDQINVTVKNRNQTIASVFYSLFTANVGTEEIAKIYVDYGGTIKNNGTTVLTEEIGMVNSETGRLFKYKGQAEEVTLEPGVYDIECYGASGGYSSDADVDEVGKGAYVKARFTITEETTLYVYVGGKGTEYSETNEANGGYNGGGSSYNGFGGGGATDVRILKGDALETSSLLTRIIVAAGGGGNSKTVTGYGGSGGGFTSGINGKPSSSDREGLGAINTEFTRGYTSYLDDSENPSVSRSVPETELGTFGVGGSVDFDGAGAGGGGYLGGSAAHDENAGGGGGLSYVYTTQRYAKGETYYPLGDLILSHVEEKVLEDIKPYIQNGYWKGISNSGTSYIDVIDGEHEMPNKLTFNGLDTMIGNKGNGYAVIKKVDDI